MFGNSPDHSDFLVAAAGPVGEQRVLCLTCSHEILIRLRERSPNQSFPLEAKVDNHFLALAVQDW